MYCNVVTAIDKIPTYLLRFNRSVYQGINKYTRVIHAANHVVLWITPRPQDAPMDKENICPTGQTHQKWRTRHRRMDLGYNDQWLRPKFPGHHEPGKGPETALQTLNLEWKAANWTTTQPNANNSVNRELTVMICDRYFQKDFKKQWLASNRSNTTTLWATGSMEPSGNTVYISAIRT